MSDLASLSFVSSGKCTVRITVHLSIVSFDSHYVRRFRFQPKELFKFGKYLKKLDTYVVSCSGVLQGVVVNFCRYPPSLITSDCSVHGEDSILDSPFTD